MKKTIGIITTGGTLASKPTEEGLTPGLDSSSIFSAIEGITAHFDVEIEEAFCLDSSNVQPEEWQRLAEIIYKKYKKYDGMVIVHGTDTMAYTAAALSFMLPNIPIPVALTGSQLSILNPVADAVENCRLAVNMAGSGVPGVFVAFNRKIIRGTRASKVRTISFDAFESINSPYIGMVNSNGLDISPWMIRESHGICELKNKICPDVMTLKLVPGTKPELFDELLHIGYKGVYIEAFGIGGMHFERRDLPEAIRRVTQGGMTVLVGSQCLYEGSNLHIYQTGRKILKSGALESYDMTSEAAVIKLMWVLGQTEDPDTIREYFESDLAGEVNLSGRSRKAGYVW